MGTGHTHHARQYKAETLPVNRSVFKGIGRLEDFQAQMMAIFRDWPALHRQVGNRGDEGFKKACQKRESSGLPVMDVDIQGRFLGDKIAPPKPMRM
jgi:hypothetical protein